MDGDHCDNGDGDGDSFDDDHDRDNNAKAQGWRFPKQITSDDDGNAMNVMMVRSNLRIEQL